MLRDDPNKLATYVDPDCDGGRVRRKSTSGGMIVRGHHLVKSWSSNHHVVALSSGEAEPYALTQGAAQTSGMVLMGKDMRECLKAVVRSDSSAALGTSQRVGIGNVRHIDAQYLCIQERHSSKDLAPRKAKGEQNAADLLTRRCAPGAPQSTCRGRRD